VLENGLYSVKARSLKKIRSFEKRPRPIPQGERDDSLVEGNHTVKKCRKAILPTIPSQGQDQREITGSSFGKVRKRKLLLTGSR